MGGNHYVFSLLNDVWYSTGLPGVEDIINSNLPNANLFIYPNPAKTFFNIQNPSSVRVKIFDVTGNLIKSEELKAKNCPISLNGIKNGVYFVRVNDQIVKEKLIVTK
jgi:hypothetical protein